MTVTQAVQYLRCKGFGIQEPVNFTTYQVTCPDLSKTWSLKDRELVMLAEGVKWAL